MFNPDYSQLKPFSTVAVGFSGGMDSSVLACDLIKNSSELKIKVVLINVEHGIRGESSKKDSLFCKEFAKENNLPIRTYSVDALSYAKENGYSVEQSARILRYDCFFDAINAGFCDVVVLAHHLSDNAETVLFNIFRGASLTGASGMSYSDYDGKIIRPLINVRKEDIFFYARENSINFVTDETNEDVNYTRNAVRLTLMPEIKKIFPEAEKSLCRFASSAALDDRYLYSLADKALKKENGEYRIPSDLPYPIFSRCVITALKNLGVKKDFIKANADAVYLLKDNSKGKTTTLPKGILAVKETDEILIYREDNPSVTPVPFCLGKTVFHGHVITAEKINISDINEKILKSGNALYFDYDKLPENCVLRLKSDGDEFTKFGGGKVSLKKYMTDLKWAKRKKENAIVVAKEKIVYCLCEKEISGLIKIDKNSKNIIKLLYF